MKTLELPKQINEFIDQYIHLQIQGKVIRIPYFRNVKRIRANLRVLIGKGTPSEIIEETNIYAKLRGFDIENSTDYELKEFMEVQGIGIDCSGFVSHTINTWLKLNSKKSLAKYLKFPNTSIYRRIIRRFRAIENISADILTDTSNTRVIQLINIQPGDLLRLKGKTRGDHVGIVSTVTLNESNIPMEFEYVEADEYFKGDDGVRIGKVEIINAYGELKDQNWLDKDKEGVCHVYENLMQQYDDNGIRRLNFSSLLK